jgi:hypothetical protein
VGSTIAVTPQTIAAGAGTTSVTVAVEVPVVSAAIRKPDAWIVAVAFPLMGMLIVPLGIERRRLAGKRVLLAILLSIMLFSTGAVLGCGDGARTTPIQQPTNYSITVTASSGSVSQSMTLTLTVR